MGRERKIMARTRMSTGNTSHAPEIFKNHHVPKKYGGSKGQTPAKAPGQGHHHGGGYAPGATAGNLVTKGNLNAPSFMYKPYNKKPYLGKHHLYSYTPPVSHISNPATRTHMPAPGTVSSIANPATRTHMAAPVPVTPAPQQQGFSGKNQLRPSSGPNINAPIIAAIWYPFAVVLRGGTDLLRGIFGLTTIPKGGRGVRLKFYGGETEWSPWGPLRGPDNPLPPGPEDIFTP
jgi:hypothetical protein